MTTDATPPDHREPRTTSRLDRSPRSARSAACSTSLLFLTRHCSTSDLFSTTSVFVIHPLDSPPSLHHHFSGPGTGRNPVSSRGSYGRRVPGPLRARRALPSTPSDRARIALRAGSSLDRRPCERVCERVSPALGPFERNGLRGSARSGLRRAVPSNQRGAVTRSPHAPAFVNRTRGSCRRPDLCVSGWAYCAHEASISVELRGALPPDPQMAGGSGCGTYRVPRWFAPRRSRCASVAGG